MAGEIVASQVVGKVTGDISGLKSAYAQAKAETNSHMSWLRGAMGGMVGVWGGMLAAVGLEMGLRAIVGGIVGVISSAGNFQAAMTRLVTSAGELRKNLGMVSAGILQMSIDTATSTDQLAAGMYYVESAGYHAADALNVLKVAAMGARSENADLDVVATALTTVMHDYHMKASQAADAMNGLITTVQNGKVNLQFLSLSMGAVLPIASALGINFANVAGVLDTMTNAGVPAEQATQNLAHVLIALEAPSKIAVKAMQSVGLSAQQVADALKNQGLPEALQMIEDAVGKQFPAGSVAYETALKNILGGLVGLKLAAQITGDSLQLTKNNIDAITKAMQGGKGAVLGWSDVQATFNYKIDRARETIAALGIKIGTYLLPIVGQIADFFSSNLGPTLDNIGSLFQSLGQDFSAAFDDKKGQKVKDLKQLSQDLLSKLQDLGGWLKDHLTPALKDMATAAGNITDWISKSKQHFDTVKQWWKDWGGLIMGASGAITFYFLPAIGAAATASAINSIKIYATIVTQIAAAGTASIVSAGQMWTNAFSFVGAMVATSIAAGKQALILSGTWIAQVTATGAQAIWAGLQMTGAFIAAMAKVVLTAAIDATILYGTWIIQLIATGTQAVIAAGKMAVEFVGAMIKVGVQAGQGAAALLGFSSAETAAGTAGLGAVAPLLALGAAIAGFYYVSKLATDAIGAWIANNLAAWFQTQISAIQQFIAWIQQLLALLNQGGQGSGPQPGGGKGGDYPKTGGFSGGRAAGGAVYAGRAYTVGEQGRELFIPQQRGTIIPHGQTEQMLAGAGGGDVHYHNHFEGITDDRALQRRMIMMSQSNQALYSWRRR